MEHQLQRLDGKQHKDVPTTTQACPKNMANISSYTNWLLLSITRVTNTFISHRGHVWAQHRWTMWLNVHKRNMYTWTSKKDASRVSFHYIVSIMFVRWRKRHNLRHFACRRIHDTFMNVQLHCSVIRGSNMAALWDQSIRLFSTHTELFGCNFY